MSRRNDERDRLASCAGKVAHETRAHAERAAARQKRSREKALRIYRCRHCGFWHLAGIEDA